MDNKQKCIGVIAILLAMIAISLATSITPTSTGNNTTIMGVNTSVGVLQFTHDLSNATNQTITGFGFAPETVQIQGGVIGAVGQASWSIANRSSRITVADRYNQVANTWDVDSSRVIIIYTGFGVFTRATISSWDSDGITLNWTKSGSPTGTATFNIIGYGNTTSSTGGSGTGCTGNCSYDNISINTLSKNDTTDTYGLYINLNNGFAKFKAGVSRAYMGLTDGESAFILVQDIVSGFSSEIQVHGNNINMGVSNGTSTEYLQTDMNITLTLENRTYNFNETYLDMDGSNITTLNNTNSTGRLFMLSTNVPEKAALFDGKGALVMYDNGTIRFQQSTNGIGDWFLRLSSGVNVGYIQYSTPSVGGVNYPGIIFRNATQGQRSQVNLDGEGLALWSSPSTAIIPGIHVTNTSNLKIDMAGKGVSMKSPDGTNWCLTITNAGGTLVSAGACT